MPSKDKFMLMLCLVTISLSIATVCGQEAKSLSVEWIYSDEGRAVDDVPQVAWLENGSAILNDLRIAKDKRTFEKLDPTSGKRTLLVDRDVALNSLKTARGDTVVPTELEWPVAFSSNGRFASYLYNDDIYLLDLERSRFRRITTSEAKEKSVNFAPDGQKLAFVRDNNLFVYDIKADKTKQLTNDGTETLLNGTLSWVYWEEIFARRDIGYWWSGDSRAIAYLQTDESEVSLMHYVDFKPWVPRVITQRYPKTGEKNPAVRAGVIELGSEKTTWIDFGEHNFEYLVRVKWMPDNRGLTVQTMNRAQTEVDLFLADRKDGSVIHILQETDPGWVNLNDDLYILKDGKQFIWQSERDGYAHLYRFSIDGKLINQITSGDWSLRASGGVFWLRQSIAAVDEAKKHIYFTALKESSIERHLYRVNFDGSDLKRLSKEKGTHAISFSPDSKYYLDRYSNIKTMPALRLHHNDGKLISELAAPRPELLTDYSIRYPELFSIPAADGFQMPAEILKPHDFDPGKKYPVIFYIYAGPSAPTVFDAWRSSLFFDQMLLDRGYLVVRFDHRVSTAISKTLENKLKEMMSGPLRLQDILFGVNWLKSQPYVDADRFGIWGWSGGGSYTLNAMTNSQEFKAGISVAPVTDWRYYDTKWGEFLMGKPQDNPEGYHNTSFLPTAKNLHGRLLLVHGTYDDNVHPENSWHFIEKLIQNNVMFDMMFYPMRKHGISDDPARIHLYNKMLEFWEQNL